MFKVLPQMKRLAKQVCEKYGLEIEGVVEETEGLLPATVYADGSVEFFHRPYYQALFKAPNPCAWRTLICIQASFEPTMSTNNVTVIVRDYSGTPHVIPSWRGKLIDEAKLSDYTYYIDKGYMLIKPPPEYMITPRMRVSSI